MSILDNLNENQRKAAEIIEGPLLILAGAGSGKTRTLTYRIAHMIKEKNIEPYFILAVTFTNKAAKEMKERVESLVGIEGEKVMISTFHSFGVRLLRMYAKYIGYDSNFGIYDSDDQLSIVKRILKEIGREINLTPNKIVSIISKAKEDGITPEEFEEKRVFFHDYKTIAEVYKRYQKELLKNNSMDFSDLLIYTNKLLDIEEVKEKLQNRYKYIMVDEYQDTNDIQYQIVTKIALKYRNLCVVGDEDQSIYGFRGANIDNILNFEKDYKDAKVIKLERNYRSTEIILEAANSVIKNNTTSKGKKLWTDKKSKDLITVYEAKNGIDEAYFVAHNIIKNVDNGRNYREFTILYRTNAQSRIFEEVFLKHNLPYKIFGGMQFYQRKEIKDILAYLNVINNPNDDVSLLRIINVPNRKIGARTIEKIRDIQYKKGISLFETLKYIEEATSVRSNTKNSIIELYNFFKTLIEEKEFLSVTEIFDEVIEKTRYLDSLEEEVRVENVLELKNSIIEQETRENNIQLSEYLENISLVSTTDNLEENQDYIKLMTIHNSKGLEFPVVYLVGMEEDIFPGKKVEFDDKELEEERRLCYVAITRAEEKLVITYANERNIYGRIDSFRDKSRFLDEIPMNLLKYINRKEEKTIIKKEKSKKIENFNPFSLKNKGLFNVGDKIYHNKFGNGIIKNIEENKRLIIKFKYEEKKIAIAVAEKVLKKI
ncbi:DNA helicase-2/ATP-dependent DNA helicase PcrA [Hypnocyclicus thermotrophus]|uniref:DNA 3'-5' helicase n=1 Tax=Hypnocyclicus thermotrophus TaxID=1627895 RepID=A0AA46I5Z2_9FUSO|nr:UvrD-helicase domain-containing protein [Hypnocyclicus thermotrophus]TDT71877.1 DNA helicase-2/ATP-dependent DNA helicase PcrA [Hypnocyclicus thermotrophus]